MNTAGPDLLARRWLTVAGTMLLVLAGVVMFGRFAGVRALVTVVPDGAPMAFPTAIGFVGLGSALLAHGRGRALVGNLLGLALVVFGVATLALYVSAEPLGIRRFIYDPANPVISRGVGFDGRMSPNAAGAFSLAGATLLLLSARRLRLGLAGAGVAVLLALALLALVSYITGLRGAVEWWRYTAMAVHTSLGFLVAALGCFVWLVRRVASADRVLVRTLPFFVVAGMAVVVLCAVVLVSNEQRQAAARLENHTLLVEAGIDRLIAAVARLESATRAYALTGDEPYLARIDVHRASIAEAVAGLVALTADERAQHAQARALTPLVERKLAVNAHQVEARRNGGAEAAAAALRAEAPEVMAGLRAATEALQTSERRRLMQRREQTALNEERLQWVLAAGAIVTLGLMCGAFSLVHLAQRALQVANEKLEERVQLRTTELEASAAQLRESEGRLQFLADTMPQLVWTAGPDGLIATMNRGWLNYLGVETEAEALRAYAAAMHPDDLPATMQEWAGMLRDQRSAGGEARLRRVDGMYRWHLWRAHAEHGPDDRVVRWVGTWTDIHDQKTAEEVLELRVKERTVELAASEERFRQAFESAGIGMAIVAPDGRWDRVNNSLCEILGYAPDELRAKTFQDITHPEDLAGDLALLEELIAGKRRAYQMEKRYLHRNGSVVWARLTVSMVRDAEGRLVHFISQIEDVSAQKRLEENLARARDQALEASRLKSEFLATMSHEIRTPMNGVIGMTSLLRHTPLTPAQEEYVHTIESSGESLLAIIDDILDYSKIEAGRIELEVAPFELRACVRETVDLFAVRAKAKGLDLRCDVAGTVPAWVSGDATRLRQVMMNLLSNALKFTTAGAVTLRVETKEEEGGMVRLGFAVQDTGIGIAPEGMQRLFKSFSQVDASTTRRFGGTGLGLAISKRLVELMGGVLEAESTPGQGSTFRFTVVMKPEAAAPRPTKEIFDGTLGVRCPLRLLLAEDNLVNQRVATLLLKRLGYETVTVAANGLQAVEAVRSTAFDAVLMDVEMPELDGCAATKQIRALPGKGRRPWIIALTAGAMQGDRERALSSGMNDFVTKPVRSEALAEALERAHAALAAEPAA